MFRLPLQIIIIFLSFDTINLFLVSCLFEAKNFEMKIYSVRSVLTVNHKKFKGITCNVFLFFHCTQHLNNLLENYLEPLRNVSFLTSAEVTALFGNIREIVAFQRLFLQALREAIDIEPHFHKFDQPYEFKVSLTIFTCLSLLII